MTGITLMRVKEGTCTHILLDSSGPSFEWSGDSKTDRKLAEKIFYRDFSFRDMSKRGGHGCLTTDHEVLTPDGWCPIADKPPIILAWQEGKSFFDVVSHWEDKPYTGDLVVFRGNSIHAVMTPDHRVPYRADMRSGHVRERPANYGPQRFMPLGDGWIGGLQVVPARLIAAFMADGYQKSVGVMEFHLHKKRKHERLIMLCAQYGFEWYYIADKTKICIKGNLPKHPGAFQLQWTRKCLEDYVDELKYWDGTIGETSVSISSSHREDLEWLQTFGRIIGIGGAISKPYESGFGSTIWRLQQNKRKWANGNSLLHFNIAGVIDRRVLCPTVSTGWFYVRSQGKIFVTGNTNYVGTPWTMSRHLKVPVRVMELFQERYFGAFPGIPRFHRWVAQEARNDACLGDLLRKGEAFLREAQ